MCDWRVTYNSYVLLVLLDEFLFVKLINDPFCVQIAELTPFGIWWKLSNGQINSLLNSAGYSFV